MPDHDQDEDQRDRRIGHELLAGRPDDLAKLVPHLGDELDRSSPVPLRRAVRLRGPLRGRSTCLMAMSLT